MAKSFEVSREGYEVVMTVRLSGEEAAAFTAGRHLELELGAGRGLVPAPAPGFSAMLDRVSRVVIAGGGVRAVADDARDPTPLGAGDWVGFRGRFWAVLLRPGDAGVIEPRSGASAAFVTAEEPARYVDLQRGDPEDAEAREAEPLDGARDKGTRDVRDEAVDEECDPAERPERQTDQRRDVLGHELAVTGDDLHRHAQRGQARSQ